MTVDLVFLDIDGVFNSVNSLIRIFKLKGKDVCYDYPLDFKCVKRFVSFIKKTGAKIVLSSNWRFYEGAINYLIMVFKRFNLPTPFIGFTPKLNGTREDEIRAFLATFPYKVRSINIFDDRKDMGEFSQYQTVVDPNEGLSRANIIDAFKKYKRNIESYMDCFNKCRRLEYGFY